MINIAEVEKYLDQVFGNSKDDYSREILYFLDIMKGENLKQLLLSIIKNEDLLREISAQSYSHYNGFDKIVLLSPKKSTYKLRLHIWWPGKKIHTENVHNHDWDFGSYIIAGSYISQEFECSVDGIDLYHYKYLPPRGRFFYSMKLVGKKTLKCTSEKLISKGASYVLPHHVYHNVIGNPSQLTATLMLHGPQKNLDVDVFSFNPVTISDKISATPFFGKALRDKLQDFLIAIE